MDGSKGGAVCSLTGRRLTDPPVLYVDEGAAVQAFCRAGDVVRKLREVENILGDVYTEDEASRWLVSRNRNLYGQVPMVLLIEGEWECRVVIEEAERERELLNRVRRRRNGWLPG